ncbi:MAG: Bug family tripartite tricarboxylate transporter substrate binding protein [Alphaproteobacteria bacterium]
MTATHLAALACALSGAFAGLAAVPAAAQSPADFYKGKTVSIVVSYAPGGGYDNYSRLLSRHIANHIPGKPTVIVQNMPGGAGITASNHVYVVAPKDGTLIAAVDQNIPMLQLLGGKGVQFDMANVQWLGNIASSNGIAMYWHATPFKTLDDAKNTEITMGATGANDDAWVYAKTMNALLGTKFKVIRGYQGTSAVNLAIEAGEVQSMGRATYYGFASQRPDWIRDKKVTIFVQLGFQKQAELPDVPMLRDLVQGEEAQQIVDLVSLPTSIGYSHWLAPEVPKARADALRAAYVATLKDAAMLADAKKANLEVVPKTAAELEALIKQTSATPQPIRDKTATILEWN